MHKTKNEVEEVTSESDVEDYEDFDDYEDDEYSILKIVADNIDGGIYTIQQRVKRYEKNI